MKVIQFHLDSQSLLKAMRNGKKKSDKISSMSSHQIEEGSSKRDKNEKLSQVFDIFFHPSSLFCALYWKSLDRRICYVHKSK